MFSLIFRWESVIYELRVKIQVKMVGAGSRVQI